MRSVRMRSGENPNGRKLQGTGVYATNLAADICHAKMVAGLLSHPKRQFYPPENNETIKRPRLAVHRDCVLDL